MDSWIFIDEAQNIPKEKTFMTVTRLGEGAKLVIAGDISTGQLNPKVGKNNLLHYCLEKFGTSEWEDIAAVHTFYDEEDILGDPITKRIIWALMKDFAISL